MLRGIIKNLDDEQFGLKKYMLYIYIYVYRIKTATLRDTILALKKWEKNQTVNAFWRRLLVTTVNSDFREKRSTLSPRLASVYLVAISSNLLLPLFFYAYHFLFFFLNSVFQSFFSFNNRWTSWKNKTLAWDFFHMHVWYTYIHTDCFVSRGVCIYIYNKRELDVFSTFFPLFLFSFLLISLRHIFSFFSITINATTDVVREVI